MREQTLYKAFNSFFFMLTEYTSMMLDQAEVHYELGLVEKHQKTL